MRHERGNGDPRGREEQERGRAEQSGGAGRPSGGGRSVMGGRLQGAKSSRVHVSIVFVEHGGLLGVGRLHPSQRLPCISPQLEALGVSPGPGTSPHSWSSRGRERQLLKLRTAIFGGVVSLLFVGGVYWYQAIRHQMIADADDPRAHGTLGCFIFAATAITIAGRVIWTTSRGYVNWGPTASKWGPSSQPSRSQTIPSMYRVVAAIQWGMVALSGLAALLMRP